MSKVCEICGKAPVAGRSISHSHRVSNRMFRPNVQKITIKEANGQHRQHAERNHRQHDGFAMTLFAPCDHSFPFSTARN